MEKNGTRSGALPLFEALDGLARRRRAVARRAGAGVAAAVVLGGAVLAGWADLLLDLPSLARAALGLGVLAGGVFLFLRRLALARLDPLRLAARLDVHGGTGGRMLAAAELAFDPPADPVSAALARAAVEDAARRAAAVAPEEVESSRPARDAWAGAGVSAAGLLLAAVLWPSLVAAQALRLLDPFGDHPPYSPYSFEVVPGDAKVFFGDGLSLRVKAVGERLPARADWVVERAGGAPLVVPLLEQGSGEFPGTLAAVEEPFQYFVRGPEGRSRRWRVEVIHTPRLESLEVRVEPPAYTRKPAWTGKFPEGGLVGLKRTKVSITAASNRPLAKGRLTWTSGLSGETPLAAQVGPSGRPDRVSGAFAIEKDARFELTFEDPEGHALREPFAGRVTVLADRRPSIALLEPPPESFATPTAVVPVAMEADDDFGLTRVSFFRSLNGSRERALDLPLPEDAAMPLRLGHRLELAPWGLDPGDLLEIHAETADNDPDGAKAAQSKVHRIRIISEQEYLEVLRRQQRMEDLLDRYRPVAEALDRAREAAKALEQALDAGDAKAAEEALARMNEALAEAETLAREQAEAPPVFEVDKEFQKELRELAKQLEGLRGQGEAGRKALAQERSRSGGVPNPGSEERKALDALRKALDGTSDDHEQRVQAPLEELEKIHRLMEYEARFTALALAQQDLARRAQRFADRAKVEDPDEREAMRALAEEQRALETELAEVLQGIRDAAGRLPRGEPYDDLRTQAEEFATAVLDAGAPEALRRAERSLAAREGSAAAADATRAAELLLAFVSRCQSMGQQAGKACLKFQPSLAQAMQSTLQQLLAGMGLPGFQSGSSSGAGMAGAGGRSNAARGGAPAPAVYGNRPTASRSGGGRGRSEGGTGAASALGGTEGGAPGAEGRADLLYGGVPIQSIPGEYRAAVREFFRRVAEESGR